MRWKLEEMNKNYGLEQQNNKSKVKVTLLFGETFVFD
jgi:hypothetical protein